MQNVLTFAITRYALGSKGDERDLFSKLSLNIIVDFHLKSFNGANEGKLAVQGVQIQFYLIGLCG